MENKVIEAVRESVESLRSSLLEELWQLRSRVDLVEEKLDCVMLASAATASASSINRLHQDQPDADDDTDVGQNCFKKRELVHLLLSELAVAVSML